jgi:hypothetical protein
MSKKSRKRNKKILAALALAGGAAMLGRGKGVAQGVSGADKAAFTSDAAYKLPSKAAVATDIAEAVVPRKSYLSRMSGVAPDGGYVGQDKRANLSKIVRGVVPPSELVSPVRTHTMRGMKGGGIAKRGTGAAYKSGGRVKSMGIAKRGGGAAKR